MARHFVVLFAPALLCGCELVFGVGDPSLAQGSGGHGGSQAGMGGAPPSCVGVVCDDDNPCTLGSCAADGKCTWAANDAGMPEQIPGDCGRRVCNAGLTKLEPDDADLPPDDGNPCTVQACVDGAPTVSVSVGQTCNGQGTCDQGGLCSFCNTDPDCGANSECAEFTCVGGACQADYTAQGTEVATQIKGDCKSLACTGDSATPADVPADDPFDDGNACTKDACDAGAETHTPMPAGTPCTDGFCDGAGLCLECVEDANCMGDDDGTICLPAGRCGCNSPSDCKGLTGRVCLASRSCGCKLDADCAYANRMCDQATGLCIVPAIPVDPMQPN